MTKKRVYGYVAIAGLAILTTLGTSRGLLADDHHDNKQGNNNHGNQGNDQNNNHGNGSRAQQGFSAAPVYLNLAGKDRDLVGLGSYLVNVIGGCNDCHTNPSYATGGNPFMGQPKMVNKAGYLAGGMAFGPFISRNITPNAKGLPAGHTFQQFETIIRTGADLDQLHTTVSPLLQVMPWPGMQDLTERDLRAIYEYLSTIPCIEGGPGQQPGRCTP